MDATMNNQHNNEGNRRMEQRLLQGFIDVAEKVSDLASRITAVETTLKTQVQQIEKYNNVTGRVRDLEERANKYDSVCDKIQQQESRKRIPWNIVVASIISGGVVAGIGLLFNLVV